MGKISEQQAVMEQPKQEKTLQIYVKSMEKEIAKALPSVITPERFSRMVLTALSSNKELRLVEPKSFLGAMMNAAQLGLEPNTPLGQAYILPYKDHGVLKAQFQIGYKGLIDLAYRSGQVTIVDAQIVYENDDFDYELGLDPKLKHKPALKNRGEPVMVYAMFRTKYGGFGFQVMSMDDCRAHAKRYSKAYSSYSPWSTSFEEMSKKTALKKALKYAPLKSDFLRGLAEDGTIKMEISSDMSEVPPEEIEYADYADIPVDAETGEVINNA